MLNCSATSPSIASVVADGDSEDAPLDGNQSYEVTFAPGQEPPVSGFW